MEMDSEQLCAAVLSNENCGNVLIFEKIVMFSIAKYNQCLNTLMILIVMMVEVPIIDGLFAAEPIPTNNLINKSNYCSTPEGVSGDLYNIFKERLRRIQQELSYHKLNDDQNRIDNEAKPEDEIKFRSISRLARGNGNGYVKHSKGKQGSFYNWLHDQNFKVYGEESTNNNEELLNGNTLRKLNSYQNNGSKEMLLNNDNPKPPEGVPNENHYNDLNSIEEHSGLQYMPSKMVKWHSSQCRREAENSSLYPSILTKALEISLNPTTNTKSSGNFLANVAQQMNTSAISLAKELTKPSHVNLNENINLNKIFKNYASNNALPEHVLCDDKEQLMGTTTANLGEVLDKVLYKLEQIHKDRYEAQEELPDGIPCDIVGTWSSSALGLYFDIQQLNQDKIHVVSSIESNNTILAIEVRDCTPPKRHQLIVDLDWKFGGSAVKQIGGPFYMYAQKISESLVGTFLGFCRTCGGIDTIFGSWSFLLPSKDCMDISLAFDVKKDLLHRVRMVSKRKERLKDSLYKSHVGKHKA